VLVMTFAAMMSILDMLMTTAMTILSCNDSNERK